MLRLALALLLALTVPAAAQVTGSLGATAPALKREVTVASNVVRIGDFIENAGAAAHIPIFRAPDLGETGSVSAKRVLAAARAHNVLGVDDGGITEVMVTHASRAIMPKEIEGRIAQALARQSGADADHLVVKLDREARTLHVEPSATGELQLARLSYDARSGYFDMTFDLPGSAAVRRLPLRFTGTAVETVDAAMLSRPMARGEIVRRSDIVVERRPKAEVGSDFIGAADQIVGLSLRRSMRAGQMLRRSDLMKPELVQRNETVTLMFEVPGIMLTSRGKALETGARGDAISVLNLQSKRTVQATITDLGTVTVTRTKPRIAANATGEPADFAHDPRTE